MKKYKIMFFHNSTMREMVSPEAAGFLLAKFYRSSASENSGFYFLKFGGWGEKK